MISNTEVELKFLVPQAARAAIAAEMTRSSVRFERRTLAALYLDTPDRRLAKAGIAWRLRREGRRWIQTLKGPGSSALERFEHEVIRPGPVHDAGAHAGTRVGDKLLKILRDAGEDKLEVGVRFQTEVKRIARRTRTRGATVEIALDEGRLLAGGNKLRLLEVEFELVAGSAPAMLALAERWRKRFGLIHDPRSKAERGDRLAEGSTFPPVRKARMPGYAPDADVVPAFGAVVDECLAQISANAIGLVVGDPASRAGHVHQVRVGIRRLRSALRSFDGWVPPPPPHLVDTLKGLFADLGQARDSDVFDSGVATALEEAGAPALIPSPVDQSGPDPVATMRSPPAQQLMLAWINWRMGLAEAAVDLAPAVVADERTDASSDRDPAHDVLPKDVLAINVLPDDDPAIDVLAIDLLAIDLLAIDGQASKTASASEGEKLVDEVDWQRKAAQRLRRWHRRIVADWKGFDELEEQSLHSLRKRIKRQRYAVQFFAPILRRRQTARYLRALAAAQDRMGELNDLFAARSRYRARVDAEPAAWFALGWLAARIDEARLRAKPDVKRLARSRPPGS